MKKAALTICVQVKYLALRRSGEQGSARSLGMLTWPVSHSANKSGEIRVQLLAQLKTPFSVDIEPTSPSPTTRKDLR